VSSGQVIIDPFIFRSIGFMIEQRVSWGGGALWVNFRAFGDYISKFKVYSRGHRD